MKVRACWRASSVVGTTTATCAPDIATHEGGAQRDLGLAEADIAADQAVHRPAGGQVLQHVGDGARLVLGLGEGEAGAELVPGALGRRGQRAVLHAGARAAMRISSPAMSRMR